MRVSVSLVTVLLIGSATSLADPLPAQLQGTWRIARLIPTTNMGCWDSARAQFLVGTTLTYSPKTLHWQGGDVPLTGIVTRMINENDLKAEFDGDPKPADFAQLQIKQPIVTEVNLQHEDADITGGSTEVPGDSVLLVAPNRILGSACGVYFEAQRVPTPHRPTHK
ncbi:hypothetical protein GOB94_09290 [Granulicella sp. 5B5]|nr:hypothetical protein GOB94_09290 [Granulicella sp. 5B5]